MNNDISRDITSMSSKMQIPTSRVSLSKISDEATMSEKVAENTSDALNLNFLGTLGHAQVNMHSRPESITPSVRKSVEEFVKDPFNAEARVELEDGLMQNQGYDVWKAMKISDRFFTGLRSSDTYKE